MKLVSKCLLIMVVVLFVFVAWANLDHSQEYIEEEIPKKQVHVARSDGSHLYLDIDTYLEGVIPCEMSPTYEMEALKAQCVAARTFVVQRDYEVDDTVLTQVYMDEKQLKKRYGKYYDAYHERVQQAIEETKNQILTYDGKAISAVFYASSCGKSNNSKDYWGNDVPYLRSVDSSWDENVKGYKVVEEFSVDDFSKRLGFKKNVSKIGKEIYYDSGYVKHIMINDKKFSGKEFREALNLRSSSFSIKRKKEKIFITTYGYGHGVGMSQEGAQFLASKQKSYKDILYHYYQGVEIDALDA